MKNIHDTILKKIHDGDVDMKPRWYFVLRSVLAITGVVLTALLTVYLFSFIFFFLDQSGVLFAPAFGFRGISFFVMSSPWILIGVSVVFVLLLFVFTTHYTFSYRRPLAYSFIAIVALALLGSYLIDRTTMHARLGSYMEREGVPVLGPLYRGAVHELPPGVHAGVIVEVTDIGFVLQTEEGSKVDVHVTEDTRSPRDMQFEVNNHVFVFGDEMAGAIEAFGVRPVEGPRRERLKRLHPEEQFIRPMYDEQNVPPEQLPQ